MATKMKMAHVAVPLGTWQEIYTIFGNDEHTVVDLYVARTEDSGYAAFCPMTPRGEELAVNVGAGLKEQMPWDPTVMIVTKEQYDFLFFTKPGDAYVNVTPETAPLITALLDGAE